MSILIMPQGSELVQFPDVELACTAGTQVGDVVHISGTNACAPALATSLATMPAMGIVSRKLTNTLCKVTRYGEISGVFAGLTPGLTYFVSKTVSGAMTAAITSPAIIHEVGYAISPTKFAVQIDSDFTVVP